MLLLKQLTTLSRLVSVSLAASVSMSSWWLSQPLEAGDEVGVGQVLDDVGAVEDPARLKIKQKEKIRFFLI